MQKASKVIGFIQLLFKMCSFEYDCRFYEEKEDGGKIPRPWLVEGELDMELVEYASDILGTTSGELLELDDKRIARWLEFYPLIAYGEILRSKEQESYLKDHTPEARLMAAALNYGSEQVYTTRHDLGNLKKRTEDWLEKQEKELPGSIHPGAEMEHFHANTVYICHYERIKEMLACFVFMVDRGKELFFKALEQDLTEEEICEYNLIVTATGIRDRHYNLHGLYYRYLEKFRSLYISENGKDFFDYVVLYKDISFQPWKFAEIIEDRALMERYLSLVPRAKMLMQIFAIEGTRFKCSFTWSDAKPLSQEEYWDLMQEHPEIAIRLEKAYGGKQPTFVYIPKDDIELGTDGPYFEMLRVYSVPEEEGGIPIPTHGAPQNTDVKKTMARINAVTWRS